MRIDHNSHQQLVFPKPIPDFPVQTSIIIGNYNHSHMVSRLVDNLWYGVKKDEMPEIIIGDSGSNEENQKIIFDLINEYRDKLCIHYVYCDLSKERASIPKFHGAVFCINAAARVASTDILIYCDSSIVVPPTFLFEMSAPHCGEMHGFVRAPLLNIKIDGEENPEDRKQPDYYQKLLAKYPTTRSHGRPAWSMKREDYYVLGGMDEEMNRYAVADDDLVSRVLMRGWGNWMCETGIIHIYHPEPRDDNEHYNAKIMEKHIRDWQFVVNQAKPEWGTYTWSKSNV